MGPVTPQQRRPQPQRPPADVYVVAAAVEVLRRATAGLVQENGATRSVLASL